MTTGEQEPREGNPSWDNNWYKSWNTPIQEALAANDGKELALNQFRQLVRDIDDGDACFDFVGLTLNVIGESTSLSDDQRLTLIDACDIVEKEAPLPALRFAKFVRVSLDEPAAVVDTFQMFAQSYDGLGSRIESVAREARQRLGNPRRILVVGELSYDVLSAVEGLLNDEDSSGPSDPTSTEEPKS